MNKIEHLKENILNEKTLLNKMILNYDKNFLDYAYYSNINYLYEYTNEIYSNLIDKDTFEKKTKYLMKYLSGDLKEEKKTNSNIIEKHLHLKKSNFEGIIGIIGIIEKINDDCFLNYYENVISLITYDIKKNILMEKNYFIFQKDIESVSFYNDKNDKDIYYIFACLMNERVVEIFKLNIKYWDIEIMKEKIEEKEQGCFMLCKYVGNNQLATIDDIGTGIDIWRKNKEEGYSKIKRINLCSIELLFVNNESLVVPSNEEKIVFFNNKDFNEEKTLYVRMDIYIDSIKDIKEYIIYNGPDGVGIISIIIKELVMLIEGYHKRIFITNEAFYLFDKEYCDKFTMLKYELMSDDFIQDIQYKDNQYKYFFNEQDIYDPEAFYEMKEMIIIKNRMLLSDARHQIYITSELSS